MLVSWLAEFFTAVTELTVLRWMTALCDGNDVHAYICCGSCYSCCPLAASTVADIINITSRALRSCAPQLIRRLVPASICLCSFCCAPWFRLFYSALRAFSVGACTIIVFW